MDYQRTVSRMAVAIQETDHDLVLEDIKKCLDEIALHASCETGKTLGQIVCDDNAIVSVDVRTKVNKHGMWIQTTVSLMDVKGEDE